MAKFKMGEDQYQVGKLDAFDQLKLVKRLVGPVAGLLASDQKLREFTKDIQEKSKEEGMFHAFAEAISSIKDEDLDFLILKCCSVCEWHHAGAWTPVLTPQGVFADPSLSKNSGKLLRIVYEALVENLSGFFAELPSILGGETNAVRTT